MMFNPEQMGKYPDTEFVVKDLTQSWFEEYNITSMDVIKKFRKLEPPRADGYAWTQSSFLSSMRPYFTYSFSSTAVHGAISRKWSTIAPFSSAAAPSHSVPAL